MQVPFYGPLLCSRKRVWTAQARADRGSGNPENLQEARCVCGVWRVACGVLCVVLCVLCCVLCVMCCVLCVLCSVWCAPCVLSRPLCGRRLSVVCRVRSPAPGPLVLPPLAQLPGPLCGQRLALPRPSCGRLSGPAPQAAPVPCVCECCAVRFCFFRHARAKLCSQLWAFSVKVAPQSGRSQS